MTNLVDETVLCDGCFQPMTPEHAHYKCWNCGNRTTCCEGAPAELCEIKKDEND